LRAARGDRRLTQRDRGHGEYRRDVVLLGEVAALGVRVLDIRCERCDRHGRLSMQRLLAGYRADAPVRRAMQDLIGECPNRNHSELQSRCDPYSPTRVELFSVPEPC
jgi:hypothetical protein